MSINRVNISGNLTRDPEMRGSGTSVLAFGVAVNDRRKNPDTDEWEDCPNYVDCVLFGRRAQSLQQYLHKGDKVAIEGKLRWSQWESDAGRRSKLEVVVDEIEFMAKPEGGRPRQRQATTYPQQVADPAAIPAPQGQVVAPGVYQPALTVQPQVDVYDEDIPF